MNNSLTESVAQLMATHNYHDIINSCLQLVIDGKMNSIARDELLNSKGIRRITDMKEHTLDVILDYAEMILEDNVLTDEKLTNLKMLKLFFGIEEGDFAKNGKFARVKNIIIEQMRKLYADNKIDKEEMLHKSALQGVFDLGYADYQNIVNVVAEQALARGANINDLDTYIQHKK